MEYTFRQVLPRPDKEGRCSIVLDVTWEGQRQKMSTGVSCLPEHFQPGAKRVVSPKDPHAAIYNAKLAAPVDKVEKAQLHAAANEEGFVPPVKPKRVKVDAPKLTTPADFHAAWLAENPHQSKSGARRYKQVVAHLEAFRVDWPITTLTRKEYLDYMAHVAGLGLVDSTTIKHVKFLRECFRLAGLAVPSWLKMQVRYGRSPALQAAELRKLISLPLFEQEAIVQERDMFLLQTLLMLRDSDLRQLKPHHVTTLDLPGVGPTPVLSIRQVKTGDEVRLPLPPLAASIWAKYTGGEMSIGLIKRG
jgi:hypothetical protein